jgi:hypothetical protein
LSVLKDGFCGRGHVAAMSEVQDETSIHDRLATPIIPSMFSRDLIAVKQVLSIASVGDLATVMPPIQRMMQPTDKK